MNDQISFGFQGSGPSLGRQVQSGFQCVSSMPVFQPSVFWHASVFRDIFGTMAGFQFL